MLLVRADAAAQTAQRVGGTYHHGVADLACGGQSVVHVLHGMAHRGLHRNLIQFLHKKVTVFCVHDGFHGRAQHLHAIFLQHSVLVKRRTTVQRRLPAKGQQDAVRTFLLDDFRHKIGRDRKEIHLVRDTLRCLNRGDIGIYQHGTDSLFAQSLQSLRTGIVKLAGLSDFQRSGTQHQNLFELSLHPFIRFIVVVHLHVTSGKRSHPLPDNGTKLRILFPFSQKKTKKIRTRTPKISRHGVGFPSLCHLGGLSSARCA